MFRTDGILSNKASRLESQINMAMSDRYRIEQTLQQKQINEQQIILEMNDQQYRISELKQRYSEERSKAEEEKNIISEKTRLQKEYEARSKSLIEQMASINAKIEELDEIINSPKPAPKYGNYCENGHLNCPNLPCIVHRLGNAAEIEAHEKKVENASKQKEELLKERNELDENYRYLQQLISEAISTIEQAKIRFENCIINLNSLENSLQYEQGLYKSKQQEHEDITREIQLLTNELNETNAVISDLQHELAQLMQELSNIQNDTSHQKGTTFKDMIREAIRQKDLLMSRLNQVHNESEKDTLYENIARQEMHIEELQQASQNNDQGGIFSGYGGFFESNSEKVKKAVRDIQSSVRSGITTAEDLLRGGVGTITGVMMNAAADVAGAPIPDSDNVIVDYDGRNRRAR